MQAAMEGRPIDRTAMIEEAARSLRQQMGRTQGRPRSKGSGQGERSGERSSSFSGNTSLFSGNMRNAVVEEPHPVVENAQRRIRSAENDHRIIHTQQFGPPRYEGTPTSASSQQGGASSALDNYPAEEEPSQHPGFEDPHFGDLKRPASRKKDPSASAAAGLGAFSSPVKMTDAFEQRKTRQPIPVESWGPRPPSRHGLPTKAAGLEASSLEEERGPPLQHTNTATSTRGRSDGSSNSVVTTHSVVGGTWAAARYAPLHETRRGRERKAKDRSTPEDLGIYGCSPMGRPPSSQQLAKSFSGVFDHSIPEREGVQRPSVTTAFSTAGTGNWASHVDQEGALEVSGLGLGEHAPGAWPSSPVGSVVGGSPPTRKGARHSETVSVEDVEAVETDLSGLGGLGIHAQSLYRRDATPPQVIVTRSQLKKDRGDVRRGREERTRERGKNMPFSTGLDPDFLSLFAS
mmetsp:Transcript_94457/g.148653  ORF Transcript_94457/g.148653 Transcript_94457/m.148653 type:complete len:460 (-) Transcript_94457:71-1450(-)